MKKWMAGALALAMVLAMAHRLRRQRIFRRSVRQCGGLRGG
ncbi:MAG: hypothetical protein ACLRPX_03375 [Ruthenibacterium sp.]